VYSEGGPAPLLADISTQPFRWRTLRQMRVSPERQVYSIDFVRKKIFLIIKLRIFAPLLTSWPISLLLSTESTNLVGPIPWSRTDDSCSISEYNSTYSPVMRTCGDCDAATIASKQAASGQHALYRLFSNARLGPPCHTSSTQEWRNCTPNATNFLFAEFLVS